MTMSIEDQLIEFFKVNRVPHKTAGQDKHVRAGWVGIPCPLCGDNGGYHMGIHVHFVYASCWLCGKHSFYDVVKALGLQWSDIKHVRDSVEKVSNKFDNKKRGRYRPPLDLMPLTGRHRTYLKGRNVDVDADWFVKCKVQSIGPGDPRYKYRIFLPVLLGTKEVSFTTRSTLATGQRYLSASAACEELPHKDLLYNEDLVKSVIMVHEGPMDALAVGPGAVATFGTSYTKNQINRIGRYPKRFICFDNEPVAQRRAEQLADELSVLPGVTFNIRLDAKDAASAPSAERARLRRLLGGG